MAREDIVQKWLDHVHEDISAAEDLHKTGHQLYVAFLCHQAIEKALKAYYIATHDDERLRVGELARESRATPTATRSCWRTVG